MFDYLCGCVIGLFVVSEFIVAYNMVRQDLARPKSVPPTPIDMTPNMTNGKYFVGKKVPTKTRDSCADHFYYRTAV